MNEQITDIDLIKFLILSFTSLFALINPIGFAPMFISLVEDMNTKEKNQIANKGVITAGLTLIIFLFIGEFIFQFFGITIEAFKIAGGILFMKSSFNLIEVKKSRTRTTPAEEESIADKDDIAYTPIGIPLIAGPGAITSIMVLSTSNPNIKYKLCLLFVIILTMLFTLIILRTSSKITKRIGTSGLRITQRLMGIILLTISVQFIVDGIKSIIG
tara:strand:- start:8 stop:652 length:645 start_codon:yes stop_codon:yes gene_type:complete